MQLPALGIQPVDLSKAYGAAAQVNQMRMQNKLTQSQMDRSAAIDELRGNLFSRNGMTGTAAPQLNQEAMAQYSAIDPDGARKIIAALNGMDARTLTETKRKNAMGAKMMLLLGDTPEQQRPMVYQQLRQAAKQQGFDVSNLPRQYDPWVLAVNLMRAVDVDKYMDVLQKKRATKANMIKVRGADGKTVWWDMTKGSPSGMEVGKNDPLSVTNIDARLPTGERAFVKAYEGKLGGQAADNYTRIQESARTMTDRIGNMDQLNSLLDNAYTGAYGTQVLGLVKGLNALGFKGMADFIGGGSASMAPAEAANAIASKMALEARKDMPGPMSDKDRDFLVSMVPGLGMTKQGRQLLAEVYKQRSKHNREYAKHARDYKSLQEKQGRYFDEGFQGYVEGKMGGKSWFSDKMRADLKLLTPMKIESMDDARQLPVGQVFELNGRFSRRSK